MSDARRVHSASARAGAVRPRLCRALLLFAIASPALLLAQFQEPTSDELKMTADPKAPGAAAVYLNYEEIDFDKEHYQNYHARIKVLTEKGKEAATVELPYFAGDFSIGSINGRTIHADGTVIPLVVKPEDLLVKKSGNQRVQRTVFTLPSVEVGSILEYAYQLRFNAQFYWHLSPDWDVQKTYFVHKAHYQFTPYDNLSLIYWPHLPQGASIKTDVAGRYTLDITDVPPIPEEEWMPPVQSVLYKVRFYYRSPLDPLDVDDFWKAQTKDWSKDVDHFAEPTRTIHAAVDSLVAPADSELDKAKKLYTAVQALDNTDYSRQKTESERRELKLKEIKRAEDTLTQKSGTSNDIALVYLAMLRAAGLTAYGLKVVDRKESIFDPSYMNFGQFDTAMVILSIGGKETILDPGEKMCPFGTLNWKHSGAGAVRQSDHGAGFVVTPLQTYADNPVRRTGDITLDEHGAITGTFQIVMTGQEALFWRQTALRNDAAELKKQFDRELEKMVPDGIEASLDHFLGLDEPDSLLMAVVKVRGSLGTATAKRIILPGFFFETRGGAPFVNQEKRLEPVDMHSASRMTDQVTYHLPTGFTVEGTPQDSKITWAGHAVYGTQTVSAPGQITIARTLARAFTLAKPEEYQDLRGFYQKVATADQQQLVLTSNIAPKGN
jgi:hypothetical protein